jgi:hypothetical protein
MADRSRGDGWWEASDGKWYPSDLMDVSTHDWSDTVHVPAVVLPAETTIPRRLSAVTGVAVIVSAAAQAGVALAGLNLVSAVRSTAGPAFIDEVPVNTVEYGIWALSLFFSLFALIVAFVLFVVWLFKSSKALDARGVGGRTWSAGWAVAGWFIPLANLVIPRLFVGEMERVAQVPYSGEAIGMEWKRYRRLPVGDLWWLLWVGGNVLATFGEFGRLIGDQNDGRFAALLAVTSVGYVMMASAGAALFALIRSITRSANG